MINIYRLLVQSESQFSHLENAIERFLSQLDERFGECFVDNTLAQSYTSPVLEASVYIVPEKGRLLVVKSKDRQNNITKDHVKINIPNGTAALIYFLDWEQGQEYREVISRTYAQFKSFFPQSDYWLTLSAQDFEQVSKMMYEHLPGKQYFDQRNKSDPQTLIPFENFLKNMKNW